ncbi:MAG TPA: DNRLRE domain-containing protein, partial [Coriobacteriia bacterium]
VKAPKLVPRLGADGSLGWYASAEDTRPALLMPPPYMTDSSMDAAGGAGYSTAVRYELSEQPGGWRLDIIADTAWLQDPARVYPVKIDPTVHWELWRGIDPDCFVAQGAPNTNYGAVYADGHYQLQTGLSPAVGNTYSLLRPWVDDFVAAARTEDYAILGAQLYLYSFYRADPSPTPVKVKAISGPWTEYGATYNNTLSLQTVGVYATADAVAGATTVWELKELVNHWISGAVPLTGMWLEAATLNQPSTWTKWDARENWYPGCPPTTHWPVFSVQYTMRPRVAITDPDTDVAFDGASGDPTLAWDYSDACGKPQVGIDWEVKDSPTGTWVSHGSVTTSLTATTLTAPTGGWQYKRYWVRMRAGGRDDDGRDAWSDWTGWKMFECTPIASTSDDVGASAHRAALDLGGGAKVDLPTGRLQIARSDLSGPGLGAPLGIGAAYDSGFTGSTGLGEGWRMSDPRVWVEDQKAPNYSFEDVVPGTDDPAVWVPSDASKIAGGVALSGVRSLKVSDTVNTGYVQVASPASLAVYPGQRLSADGWFVNMNVQCTTASVRKGSILKVLFYDQSYNLISEQVSQSLIEVSSPGWQHLTLHAQAPEGAAFASVVVGLERATGDVYIDDVRLHDGTLRSKDAAGTTRTHLQTGDGVFRRDVMGAGAGFKVANIARSAPVTTSDANGSVTGRSTDGIVRDVAAQSNYDLIHYSGDGSYWLRYDLGSTRLVSQVDLYMWDGPEPNPRAYKYRIETSLDGTSWTLAADDSWLHGWGSRSFASVKARYVRVVALNSSTGDGWFALCEMEVPVYTSADAPVVFDASSGLVSAVADTDLNVTRFTRDGASNLTSVADEVGRRIDVSRSGSTITGLTWTGISSTSTVPVAEAGIVTYGSSGSTITVSSAGTLAAAYHYGANGRIDRVADADGVASAIGWSGNKVASVTSPDGAVTSITYDADHAHVTTSGGGASTTRDIYWDAARRYQPSKTVVDPSNQELTTTVAFDGYGHARAVTSPDGTIDTSVSDRTGRTCVSVAKNMVTTGANYASDRVTSATDAKGNVTTYTYDERWRPITTDAAINEITENGVASQRTQYDEWGNKTLGDIPVATTAGLLEDPTFERDPFAGHGGWDAIGRAGATWVDAPASQRAELGAKMVALAGGPTDSYVQSNQMELPQGTTYMVSARVRGTVDLIMLAYDGDKQTIRASPVVSASTGSANDAATPLRRISGRFTVPEGTPWCAVKLFSRSVGGGSVDNVRLEQAEVAGADDLVENEGFEQTKDGVLEHWYPQIVTNVFGFGGDIRASGMYSGFIVGDPNYERVLYSEMIPVLGGQDYDLSVYMRSENLVPTSPSGGMQTRIQEYSASGQHLNTQWVTVPCVKGTTEWKRYFRTVPINANTYKVQIELTAGYSTGTARFDQVCFSPSRGISSTQYDTVTHTYATTSTSPAGRITSTDYDSRGRATTTRYRESATAGAQTLSNSTYNTLGRLTRSELAPGSGV